MNLDRTKILYWVGRTLLESSAPEERPASLMDVLEAWKQLLPDEWANDVSTDLLKGSFTQPKPDTIYYMDQYAASSDKPKDGEAGAKPVTGSRKWHEKFKADRR